MRYAAAGGCSSYPALNRDGPGFPHQDEHPQKIGSRRANPPLIELCSLPADAVGGAIGWARGR